MLSAEVERQVEHEENPYHSQAGLQVEPAGKHNKPGKSGERRINLGKDGDSSNRFVVSRICAALVVILTVFC